MALSDEVARLQEPAFSLHAYKELPVATVERLLERAGWVPAGPPLLPHQKVGVMAGLRRPRLLFRYEQGLGKTKLLLDLFSVQRRRVQGLRGVVLGPSPTSTFDWIAEAKRHRPELRVLACPEDPAAKRAQFLPEFLEGDWDLACLDYFSIQTLFSARVGKNFVPDVAALEQAARRIGWAALDEIHLAKGRNTLRVELLHALLQNAVYRYGATGTLFNRTPEEVWGQAALLDGGEALGRTLTAFRTLYCRRVPNRWTRYTYEFDPDRSAEFQARLSSLVLSYSLHETVELPGLHQERPALALTAEQQQFYRASLAEAVRLRRNGEVVAVWIKLRRILSGFTPTDPPAPLSASPKLQWLRQHVVPSTEPWVLFYEYTESGRGVVECLEAAGKRVIWLYSGAKDRLALRKRWEKGEVDVMVVQNSVGAQALNLQRARRLVFFEAPCSAITRSQAERRIYRIGQDREAYIYDLFFPGTVEERVVQRALDGMSLHQALLSTARQATSASA